MYRRIGSAQMAARTAGRRALEDRERADLPEDGRKTYALEACGSALHQTGKTRRG